MKLLKSFYINNLFFYVLLGLAALYAFSFYVESLRLVANSMFYVVIAVCAWDFIFLFYPKNHIQILRRYPEKLSNGDANPFEVELISSYPIQVNGRLLEEMPVQLQMRNNEFAVDLIPNQKKTITYELSPKARGLYEFGTCNFLVRHLGLFERKFVLEEQRLIPCYPSFIQMRKYQLLATTDRLFELGVKRIRRIGTSMEFDHIREYVKGDEYRHMNWKASAKYNKLLINQFQEEKSQPIYSLIDIGRVMRMPFHEMTLLDYAINSTLVLSNAAILKGDRAGMLTFSKIVDNHIAAEKNNRQMKLISDKLYGITTKFQESEFGLLYAFARKHINKRSLLFIYTNFETLDALNRQLPYLRMLNKSHVLVVIVFKNTELVEMAKTKGERIIEVYNQIIAEKFVYEKGIIIQELNRNGIQTIYTAPEDLSMNTINKYLEIKARGII